MSEVFEYDVFLSFASNDEKIARPIWQEMCLNGLFVFWSDATLKDKLGESWFEVIQASLENSRHFVLLCTPSSMSSEWVKREYQAFFNHCYKAGIRRMIPVLVGDFRVSSLPLFLRELEACRLDEDHSIKKITRILGGTDIEELKIALANKTKENSLLKQELGVANSRIGLLQQEISKLSSYNSILENENSRLKQQNDATNFKTASLQQKPLTLSSEYSRLKEQVSERQPEKVVHGKTKPTIQITNTAKEPLNKAMSYWKAAGTHLLLGFGLFYVDKSLGRKWIYPIVVFYAIIDVGLKLLSIEPFQSNFGFITFLISLGIYVLGFVDVLLTCRSRRNGGFWQNSPRRPTTISSLQK